MLFPEISMCSKSCISHICSGTYDGSLLRLMLICGLIIKTRSLKSLDMVVGISPLQVRARYFSWASVRIPFGKA